MRTSISADALKEMFAQESGCVFLSLLTVLDTTTSELIRFVDDNVDLVYGGNTYIAAPFQPIWSADEDEDTVPNVKIVVDAVDQRLVDALRSITEPPTATMELIMKKPNGVISSEIGPIDMLILGYDNMTHGSIELTLGFESDVLNEFATKDRFSPGLSPGIF